MLRLASIVAGIILLAAAPVEGQPLTALSEAWAQGQAASDGGSEIYLQLAVSAGVIVILAIFLLAIRLFDQERARLINALRRRLTQAQAEFHVSDEEFETLWEDHILNGDKAVSQIILLPLKMAGVLGAVSFGLGAFVMAGRWVPGLRASATMPPLLEKGLMVGGLVIFCTAYYLVRARVNLLIEHAGFASVTPESPSGWWPRLARWLKKVAGRSGMVPMLAGLSLLLMGGALEPDTGILVGNALVERAVERLRVDRKVDINVPKLSNGHAVADIKDLNAEDPAQQPDDRVNGEGRDAGGSAALNFKGLASQAGQTPDSLARSPAHEEGLSGRDARGGGLFGPDSPTPPLQEGVSQPLDNQTRPLPSILPLSLAPPQRHTQDSAVQQNPHPEQFGSEGLLSDERPKDQPAQDDRSRVGQKPDQRLTLISGEPHALSLYHPSANPSSHRPSSDARDTGGMPAALVLAVGLGLMGYGFEGSGWLNGLGAGLVLLAAAGALLEHVEAGLVFLGMLIAVLAPLVMGLAAAFAGQYAFRPPVPSRSRGVAGSGGRGSGGPGGGSGGPSGSGGPHGNGSGGGAPRRSGPRGPGMSGPRPWMPWPTRRPSMNSSDVPIPMNGSRSVVEGEVRVVRSERREPKKSRAPPGYRP